MKLFIDTEFTDLTQSAQLLSLALVSECGKAFYAVFDDYDKEKCSDFVCREVIPYLELETNNLKPQITYLKTNTQEIKTALLKWLSQFEIIQMWADVPYYDWVLFCELFGGALFIPKQIHYMCMDLATCLYVKGYDIKTERIKLLNQEEIPEGYHIHNALSDAKAGMLILKKLLKF